MTPAADVGARVAVVGDSVVVRAALAAVLHTAGHRVVVEAPVDAMAAALEGERPQACVLVASAGDPDGLDLVADSVEAWASTVHFVVLARESEVAQRVALVRCGATAVLDERASVDDVPAALAVVLDHGVYVEPAVVADVVRAWRGAPAQPTPARLTPREAAVLDGLVAGEPTKAMAVRLGLAPKTVEHHRASLFRRLGVRTAPEAVAAGLRLGHATSDRSS